MRSLNPEPVNVARLAQLVQLASLSKGSSYKTCLAVERVLLYNVLRYRRDALTNTLQEWAPFF